MSQEENHDFWLNLTLSPPQPVPETQPSISAPFLIQQPQAQPSSSRQVSVPISSHQHHHNNDQVQSSSSRQVSVPIFSHQYHHNNDQAQPSSSRQVSVPVVVGPGPSRQPRRRQQLQPPLRSGKSLDIPPPYPWAAPRRAHIRSLNELLSDRIYVIEGQVQCKHCEKVYSMEFDLQTKFLEVAEYIRENKYDMLDRAPHVWMNPVLPSCRECQQQNCAKPVIQKKRKTNWLFLLLGQMLGCCTLKHLKYFCKHTMNHRTGAKNRLLYQTYMGLCKQLYPNGPFDV